MEQTNTSIEEQLAQIRASLAEAKLGVEKQIRVAVSQAKEQVKSEMEEQMRDAAAAATLQHEKQMQDALAQLEQARSRIDKLESAGAGEKDEKDIGPRNLVICIDGTANQFGVKVRLWPVCFGSDLIIIFPFYL